MLVIRLLRVGKINQPSFKVVVTDKRNPPRGGRFVEEVGNYNPLTKKRILRKERVQYWLSQGAQPSSTVHNLLVKEGILEAKKIPVHKKAKAEPVVASQEAPKPPKPVSPAPEVATPAVKEEKPKEEPKPAEPKKEGQ